MGLTDEHELVGGGGNSDCPWIDSLAKKHTLTHTYLLGRKPHCFQGRYLFKYSSPGQTAHS